MFIGYVLYRNAVGVDPPYDKFPYLVAGVLGLAALVAAAVPGLADRVRTALADEVGFIGRPAASTALDTTLTGREA